MKRAKSPPPLTSPTPLPNIYDCPPYFPDEEEEDGGSFRRNCLSKLVDVLSAAPVPETTGAGGDITAITRSTQQSRQMDHWKDYRRAASGNLPRIGSKDTGEVHRRDRPPPGHPGGGLASTTLPSTTGGEPADLPETEYEEAPPFYEMVTPGFFTLRQIWMAGTLSLEEAMAPIKHRTPRWKELLLRSRAEKLQSPSGYGAEPVSPSFPFLANDFPDFIPSSPRNVSPKSLRSRNLSSQKIAEIKARPPTMKEEPLKPFHVTTKQISTKDAAESNARWASTREPPEEKRGLAQLEDALRNTAAILRKNLMKAARRQMRAYKTKIPDVPCRGPITSATGVGSVPTTQPVPTRLVGGGFGLGGACGAAAATAASSSAFAIARRPMPTSLSCSSLPAASPTMRRPRSLSYQLDPADDAEIQNLRRRSKDLDKEVERKQGEEEAMTQGGGTPPAAAPALSLSISTPELRRPYLRAPALGRRGLMGGGGALTGSSRSTGSSGGQQTGRSALCGNLEGCTPKGRQPRQNRRLKSAPPGTSNSRRDSTKDSATDLSSTFISSRSASTSSIADSGSMGLDMGFSGFSPFPLAPAMSSYSPHPSLGGGPMTNTMDCGFGGEGLMGLFGFPSPSDFLKSCTDFCTRGGGRERIENIDPSSGSVPTPVPGSSGFPTVRQPEAPGVREVFSSPDPRSKEVHGNGERMGMDSDLSDFSDKNLLLMITVERGRTYRYRCVDDDVDHYPDVVDHHPCQRGNERFQKFLYGDSVPNYMLSEKTLITVEIAMSGKKKRHDLSFVLEYRGGGGEAESLAYDNVNTLQRVVRKTRAAVQDGGSTTQGSSTWDKGGKGEEDINKWHYTRPLTELVSGTQGTWRRGNWLISEAEWQVQNAMGKKGDMGELIGEILEREGAGMMPVAEGGGGGTDTGDFMKVLEFG